MIRRMRNHGEPCDGWLICTGWPLASPVVPNISHVFLAGDGVEVLPEVGGDRVVGDVAHHPRLLAVLDLPERVAAELAVEALLVDRVAAAAVDQDAVLGVGDDLVRASAIPAARRRRGRSACAGTGSCATTSRTCSRARTSRRCSARSRGWSADPTSRPSAHQRPLLRLHAVIVVADRAHAAGSVRSRGDVEQLRAHHSLADVVRS